MPVRDPKFGGTGFRYLFYTTASSALVCLSVVAFKPVLQEWGSTENRVWWFDQCSPVFDRSSATALQKRTQVTQRVCA